MGSTFCTTETCSTCPLVLLPPPFEWEWWRLRRWLTVKHLTDAMAVGNIAAGCLFFQPPFLYHIHILFSSIYHNTHTTLFLYLAKEYGMKYFVLLSRQKWERTFVGIGVEQDHIPLSCYFYLFWIWKMNTKRKGVKKNLYDFFLLLFALCVHKGKSRVGFSIVFGVSKWPLHIEKFTDKTCTNLHNHTPNLL